MGSCVNQRQKSNITGRTDEVYFTSSDTRIKVEAVSQYEMDNKSNVNGSSINKQSNAGNYTSSYSNRFRNFSSTNRYNYCNYQPVLVPTMMYNPYTGWSIGMRYGSMSGFSSPFSPYYGYNMPYNDPFYSYGWGGGWMCSYYPRYIYNPYMFSYNPYGYNNYRGYGNGYNNYNQYSNNNNYSSPQTNTNYGRRTGTTSSNSNQSNSQPSTNTQNQNNNNSGKYNGSGWWNSGSGGSSGSSGSSGTGRGTSGNSGGSNRRR